MDSAAGDFAAPVSAGFRETLREWLAENFPPSLALEPHRQAFDVHGPANTYPDFLLWKARIAPTGLATPMWPKAYGGAGLSLDEAIILGNEMDRIGARMPIQGMGVNLLGPTLLEFGTEAQKRQHLPSITRGETRWCQGYSEPGAGSDLASLQCRAEDQGDNFLVNGQKVWTSGAHFADWCFCLVRTDTSRKHDGISFLLIDMRSQGVEARPIQMISGGSTFCEVFFSDVVVPKENVVGTLNGGWSIGKRLLQFERGGIGAGRRSTVITKIEPLTDIVRRLGPCDGEGRITDGDLRARVIRSEMETKAVALTIQRSRKDRAKTANPNATTSILKNATIAAEQARMELLIELLGSDGLGWEGEAFSPEALQAVRDWLRGKAGSIYGGTFEIQNNIIAKRILGLPGSGSGSGTA